MAVKRQKSMILDANTTKNDSTLVVSSNINDMSTKIVPIMVSKVIERTSQGQNIFNVFRDLNINPIEFMQYIDETPRIRETFDTATRLYIERVVFGSFDEIDQASDKLELEKCSMKLRAAQWLAERRVSKVYAAKQEINVNQTIDIRQALALADMRASSVINVDSLSSDTDNKKEDALIVDDDILG